MLILLIEDERDLAELVVEFLEGEGVECDYAADGLQGLALLQQNTYDAVILDIMLPRMNGLDLCEQMRAEGCTTPCLMLTARDSLDDRLEGFKRGTDDYLVKPFALPELKARLQAIVRRHSPQHSKLSIADLTLNLERREARRGGRVLELSPLSWNLLVALAKASPGIVSRTALEDAGWPDEAPSRDAFKVQLYRLRQQVNGEGEPPLLHTLRGAGFCLREEHGHE